MAAWMVAVPAFAGLPPFIFSISVCSFSFALPFLNFNY